MTYSDYKNKVLDEFEMKAGHLDNEDYVLACDTIVSALDNLLVEVENLIPEAENAVSDDEWRNVHAKGWDACRKRVVSALSHFKKSGEIIGGRDACV